MTPLEALYRLQDRLELITLRTTDREALPPELAGLDQEFRSKVAAIEGLRRRMLEADVHKRKAERELAELQDKLRKYQTQLGAVQTNREYSAVLNEIDGAKKQVRACEETVLGLMETVETARRELAEREAKLPAETAAHEETLRDWRKHQQDIDQEIARAREEVKELEASIPPKTLAEFYRLYEKKGRLAVVRTAGASCSACHVRIRPALHQELKARREVVYCDSCKRILYYVEDSEVASS